MLGIPIVDFDTDILISKEEAITQEFTNIVNNGRIELDNRLNQNSYITFLITPLNDMTSIKVKNTTLQTQFTINANVAMNSEILVKDYLAYLNTIEIPISFIAPFYVQENVLNELIFEFSPITATANIQVIWQCASSTIETQAFIQGFNITESKETVKKPQGKYNYPVSVKSKMYKFSIDKLMVDSEFFNIMEDDSSFYRIIYRTDSRIDGIEQQLYSLCGCSFEEFGVSQSENSLIKLSISGTASRRFKG